MAPFNELITFLEFKFDEGFEGKEISRSMTQKSGLLPEAVATRLAEARAALKRLQDNPRISKIVVVVPADACPACQEVFGSYPKDEAPDLPMEYCTHPLGCRAYYQPFIEELYP